jgi:uracil phosphoribosyltransferase
MDGSQAPSRCVRPSYVEGEAKPIATTSKAVSYDNVHILQQTPQLIALLTWVSHLPQIESH